MVETIDAIKSRFSSGLRDGWGGLEGDGATEGEFVSLVVDILPRWFNQDPMMKPYGLAEEAFFLAQKFGILERRSTVLTIWGRLYPQVWELARSGSDEACKEFAGTWRVLLDDYDGLACEIPVPALLQEDGQEALYEKLISGLVSMKQMQPSSFPNSLGWACMRALSNYLSPNHRRGADALLDYARREMEIIAEFSDKSRIFVYGIAQYMRDSQPTE